MNPRRLTLATVVVAIVVLAGVLVIPRLTSSGTQTSTSGATLDYQGQPSIGKADAPVTIAMFEDFLCPHCAEFSDQVFPQIQRAYIDTGKARAVYFYFPVIDPVQSVVIGGLGQCVFDQSNDAFWQLEPILMRTQQQLGNTPRAIDIALQYAPSLDRQKLQQCVDSGAGSKTVNKDAALGRSLGVQGTPTIFVNGKMLADGSWSTVQKAVDAALSATKN